MESICSPNINKSNNCLPKKILIKLSKTINKSLSKEDKINTKLSYQELYEEIHNHINKLYNCKSEKCWIHSISFIENIPSDLIEIIKTHYKPPKPKSWNENINTWLTNEDINNVLHQYNDKYNKHFYLGTTPIDFHLKDNNNKCVLASKFSNIYDNICKLDISNMDKKIDSLSIVFNTDDHTEPGTHWICLYVDIKGINIKNKPCIYFFDSTGNKPPKEVQGLINNFIKQGTSNNNNIDYYYNDIKHQNGTTECGVYCIHFIIYMLKGGDFESYINNDISDEFMEKFRHIYFI